MSHPIEHFDVALSNPPYQDAANRPIFHRFQDSAWLVAENTAMIYMASRWWYGTSGLATFRTTMFEHPRMESVYYYTEEESSQRVFDGTGIAGGINIVQCRPEVSPTHFTLTENSTGVSVVVPKTAERIIPLKASSVHIAEKLRTSMQTLSLHSLHDRDEMVINEVALTGSQLQALDPVQTTPDATPGEGRIHVYANISGSKGGKSDYYSIEQPEHITTPKTQYAVCMGQSIIENEHRSIRLFMFPPSVYFGRSIVSLAYFDTLEEAEIFQTYAATSFFEFCLRLTLAGRMSSLGNLVPDLEDYTSANPLFTPDAALPEEHDYSGLSLDERLYLLFGLTEDEITTIEEG